MQKTQALIPHQYYHFKKFFKESGNWEVDFQARSFFTEQYSWHLPTLELLEAMKQYEPLLSICSGNGYTESLAFMQGVDIICSDIERAEYIHMQSEIIDGIKAIKKYPERNLFLAWPPYDQPLAYNAARILQTGSVLIYVGEDWGGCTGDSQFHEYLETDFECLRTLAIPQWNGINDYVAIHQKQETV